MLRKALVVDDSELLQNMYKLILRKSYNCLPVKALNGLEGLDKLDCEDCVDLIILDINMPVMNGLEFLEKLRKHPKYGSVPVIIVSAEGGEDDVMRGLQLGANGYIIKPFKSGMLTGMIDAVLEKAASSVRGNGHGIH